MSIPVMPCFIISSTSSELNKAFVLSASTKFKEKDPSSLKEIPSAAEYTFPFCESNAYSKMKINYLLKP